MERHLREQDASNIMLIGALILDVFVHTLQITDAGSLEQTKIIAKPIWPNGQNGLKTKIIAKPIGTNGQYGLKSEAFRFEKSF